MQPLHRDINPFALMLDPQAVFAQIERSERLDRLQRRICRPLDKPLIGTVDGDGDGDGDSDSDDAASLETAGDADDSLAANVIGGGGALAHPASVQQ